MKIPVIIFKVKYKISTGVIIENPVRSPIVPPIAESISTDLAAASLVTLSKTGARKEIFTYLRLDLFISKAENKSLLQVVYIFIPLYFSVKL